MSGAIALCQAISVKPKQMVFIFKDIKVNETKKKQFNYFYFVFIKHQLINLQCY